MCYKSHEWKKKVVEKLRLHPAPVRLSLTADTICSSLYDTLLVSHWEPFQFLLSRLPQYVVCRPVFFLMHIIRNCSHRDFFVLCKTWFLGLQKLKEPQKKNCPGNYLCTGNLWFFFFFSLFAGGRRLLLLVLVVPLLFETHFCAAFVYDKMHRILKFGWYIWNFKGTCMPVNKAPDYRLSTEFF